MSVTVEQSGAVSIVSMDDGKANALSSSMIASLSEAIDAAEADDSVRAVVLTGREGRFSGGFDLSVMNGGDMDSIVSLVAEGGDLVRKLYGATVPVVAASTGHAVAAGALMLIGCDVRVSVEGPFKVGLNEVAIGMTLPEWAHTLAVERLSKRGIQRAIANARLTDPTEAVNVGFIDRVVPADQLMAAAMEEAEALTLLEPNAYARTMTGFRGATLAQMDADIAADRATLQP